MYAIKKGQAALEFIITYGWAILAVIVGIGALAYLGFSNNSRAIPTRCIINPAFPCLDVAVSSSSQSMQISLANSYGYKINGVNLSASGCSNTPTIKEMESNSRQTFTVSGCVLAKGQKYNGDLNITYVNNDTQVPHKFSGSLFVVVS